MKKALIFLLGWSPLLAGKLMNDWMLRHADELAPYLAIALGTLLVWALFGLLTAVAKETRRTSLLLLHLPAALVLALVVYQDAVRHAYWGNMLGIYSQFFYLPLLNLTNRLGGGRLYHTMAPAYVTCFVLLCAAAWLGRSLGERKGRGA